MRAPTTSRAPRKRATAPARPAQRTRADAKAAELSAAAGKIQIALIRGINVGGKRIVPMRDLVDMVQTLGASHAETFIQSGNVLFQGPVENEGLAARIAGLCHERFGFSPKVLILDIETLQCALEACPYDPAADALATVHLYFLDEVPGEVDHAALERIKEPSESWTLGQRVLYLHAPDGVGRSRFAQQAERILGVPATARNLRTVRELLERARRLEGALGRT